jgi:DNA polymerase III subunit beta
MNTNILHTSESLANMPRKALIELAIEIGAGVAKPHSTKSADLIAAVLATQNRSTEEAAPAEFVPEADVAPEAESAAPDNVVAFEPAEPVQAEIPAEPVPYISYGLFKVSRKVFQRQLAAAARVTAGDRTMPVLSCVLIGFTDGLLRVSAHDLSNHVVTEAQAETTGTHEIAIPHAVLSKFVSRCGSDFLMAEVIGEKLVISDLENRTEIMGIPATEFPPAHAAGVVDVMEISGKQLVRHVAETIKAASTDETRYILNGIAIDTKNGCFIATDGRRLVRADIRSEKLVASEDVLILPSLAAQVLMAGVPQDLTVTVKKTETGSTLHFHAETVGYSYSLSSRLVDGRFPTYHQVIPKLEGFGAEFEIKNADLVAALGRLLVVANASGKDSALRLDFSTAGLTINAVNISVGSGKEQISVRTGEDVSACFTAMNGSYLSEVVGSWGDEKVTVHVKDELSPVIVRTADKLAVIMPVRLS